LNQKDNIQRTIDEVLDDGVILCVRLGDGTPVIDACRAAARGGLTVFELTLTTPGVVEAMRTLALEDSLVVGAGTVLTVDDVRRVKDAGGRFVMSPVFDPEIVDEAHANDLLAIPGTSTPKEILTAHRHGSRLVKVFPAGALGGPGYLRAVRGPLPHVPMVPTNGPTAETIAEYVAAGAVAVGIGGEVFPPGFTVDTVEKAARRVRKAMNAARAA
jgi:2-dehydro-3-deoxyphosphogluconate aldolase/(4S)-4-hydroxy-2-oxoglutarate aldolase